MAEASSRAPAGVVHDDCLARRYQEGLSALLVPQPLVETPGVFHFFEHTVSVE